MIAPGKNRHRKTTIPLALNDPGGEWTVEVRDVATGLATIAKAVLAK